MRRIRERDSELPITESVQANARGSLTEKVVQVSPGKVALQVGESEGWCQHTRGGWVPSVGPLPAFSLDIHLPASLGQFQFQRQISPACGHKENRPEGKAKGTQ